MTTFEVVVASKVEVEEFPPFCSDVTCAAKLEITASSERIDCKRGSAVLVFATMDVVFGPIISEVPVQKSKYSSRTPRDVRFCAEGSPFATMQLSQEFIPCKNVEFDSQSAGEAGWLCAIAKTLSEKC